MKTYKIEEVASQTGLTKRTIRYYEELGLIDNLERTDSGIRLYTEDDIDRLNNIILAKEVLGFSLQDLQKFLQMKALLEQDKLNFDSSEDIDDRKMKLVEMAQLLQREIALIELKKERMSTFMQELTAIEQRVQEEITK